MCAAVELTVCPAVLWSGCFRMNTEGRDYLRNASTGRDLHMYVHARALDEERHADIRLIKHALVIEHPELAKVVPVVRSIHEERVVPDLLKESTAAIYLRIYSKDPYIYSI